MKARPMKLIYGEGYIESAISEATHVKLNFPGPVGTLHLPVILRGTRDGTNCWTWNGDTESPTLKPSVLHEGTLPMTDAEYQGAMSGTPVEPRPYRCHTWVTDGKAQFLDDCSHELRGQTVDMLEALT